jgi:lipopolysaccharide export system permease protein
VRILSRYFVARFLTLFAATLFASTLAVAIVELLLNFDDMLKVQEGAAGVLTYLLLRIPSYYLRDLIPVASFTAAFLALGLSARNFEIIAMRAGGVSPHRAVAPLLGTAALLAVASFAVHELWILPATRAWKVQVQGDAQLDYGRGSFWYHRGRTIYNIASADPATRTLRGVDLFERDGDGRLLRSIHAERVRVEGQHRWRLENAVIRSFDPARVEAAPRVERLPETVMEIQGADEEALLEADAGLLSLGRLREYLELRAGEDEPVQRLMTRLHARLAEPWSALLLALLAAPVALRVEQRRSLGQPALLGIASVSGYFLVRSVANTLASEGVLPAAAAPWCVLLAFTGFGLLQLSRVPR